MFKLTVENNASVAEEKEYPRGISNGKGLMGWYSGGFAGESMYYGNLIFSALSFIG